MKSEKKTMATLLATILIAMMGVMPALAAETGVATLTATVLPTMVGITVDDVHFGTVTREVEATSSLDIVLSGETGYTADLSAYLDDEEAPFYAPLTLNAMNVPHNVQTDFASAVSMGSHSYVISFTPPSGASAGGHEGYLTIFAVYTPG